MHATLHSAQNNSVYPCIKEHKKIYFCAQQTWVNSFESLNNVGRVCISSVELPCDDDSS